MWVFLLQLEQGKGGSSFPVRICFVQVLDSRGTSVGEEDSEFEDLVAEGREEHPLVRYTRLVRDKKAELEYVYNPVGRSRSFRDTHASCRRWRRTRRRTCDHFGRRPRRRWTVVLRS